MIKTRFAPSPTGFLHVGGLRTALYSYLFARKNDGIFALRIEDTDRERFVEGGIENILSSLYWAGLKIDEGVDLDENGNIIQKGDCGPYIQSQRNEIYKKYANQLLKDGHAYYCFCSKEHLEEARKIQELNKQPTIYNGECRNLKPEESKKRIEEGELYVIRMKMPHEGLSKFCDQVHGNVEFKNELIDDQVLVKSDGFPTYHLCNVIDDHFMGITNVMRGEEWLSSVPKHLVLYKMFGWEPPKFAHLSLLINKEKQKLSKRHGDVSVDDFKAKGYLPEALLNFVAFLGWNPGDERELFTLAEMEKEFSLERVGKPPAIFNLEKLDWYNKQYMMKMELSELTERAMPFFVNAGFDIGKIKDQRSKINGQDWLEKVVALEKERANTLVELVENVRFVFVDELVYEPELLVWKKSDKEQTKQILAKLSQFLSTLTEDIWQNRGELEKQIMDWIKVNNFGNGDVLWPMRVALSGQKNSPGPLEIAFVLGKNNTLKRIDFAVKIVIETVDGTVIL